nr:ribonuclease H-like domain-containing protein [Tanacetum cinerariifolium]
MHGPSNTSASSTQTVPTPFTQDELKVDKIVLSWIFTTLSDSLQARLVVARPRSAKEGWDILSNIVKDNKRSCTNALKAELRSIKLGDQSMEAYFQKIESIVTILASLDSHVNDEDVIYCARGDAIKVQVYISTRGFIVCFSYGAHGRLSTGDLYPVASPFSVPQAFLVSSHTWHQRLGHPRSDVLRRLVSNNFISCNKETSPVLCHACQLGKHTVLSLAASRHWPIHQLDVKNTFLHGDLSKTVYMYQPPGFRDFVHPDHVCLLQRSLYGLKQAPRAWFQRFASNITHVGLQHSRCDSSLFIYRQGAYTTYLLLYVDDIVLTTSSDTLLRRIIASFHQEFSMTDLGSLNYFLGISVTRDSSRMFLSQKKYAIEILERAHMVNCNPSQTPIDNESKLGNDGDSVSDPTLYQSLVDLVAYSNADWAGCPTTRRTTSGYYVFLGNNLLSWSSKRQLTLSHSSAGDEYRGVANTVAETFAAGQVRVLHVSSRYQFADIFTKGLPSALFEEFCYSLSVRSPPAPTAREC